MVGRGKLLLVTPNKSQLSVAFSKQHLSSKFYAMPRFAIEQGNENIRFTTFPRVGIEPTAVGVLKFGAVQLDILC